MKEQTLKWKNTCNEKLKRDDIDWSQSRVIFVSPQFTEYQKHSVNFKDVPFELWEIKKYENNLIGLVQHKTTSKVSISTTSSSENTVVKNVTREVKQYSEEDHLNHAKVTEPVKQLYADLKERILNIISPNVESVRSALLFGLIFNNLLSKQKFYFQLN